MIGCPFGGIDNSGFWGQLFNYLTLCLMAGVTIILFIYFWRTKRLDMDEEAKERMMEDENARR